ncbi:cyclic nucleotide-binding domain-containing protein [Marinomonas posidonica]|uniref:Transcriptional regulator, Crp/Fnr family n=1 Tax=Marinomonas posidonica (strain CECT 7376 / NCIMB 14433 / IVIA-Po-181) TaxID=491952 RepID=F6D0N9_MARPP|nr:cyclic nucleotide-binding domain-containing protein [Marinomonas posidonica]AEF54837.1 putative transcriptional regulator, Crp/Fnr family [Marinomonas posidonica IVIA-Po-181]
MKTISLDECKLDISTERLKTASIFGALANDAVAFLFKHGVLEELEAGETLFYQDDVADAFYIVINGRIGLFRKQQGSEVAIRFGEGDIGFGEEIGYVTMIALLPRAADAMAMEPTLVLKIDSYTFGLFHDNHSFDFGILILNLSRDMARKLRLVGGTLAENGISIDSNHKKPMSQYDN